MPRNLLDCLFVCLLFSLAFLLGRIVSDAVNAWTLVGSFWIGVFGGYGGAQLLVRRKVARTEQTHYGTTHPDETEGD